MTSDLSSKVTEGIRVNVRCTYVHDESSPRHHYFLFAYKISIINESPFPVQLLRRCWHITDGYGQKREVKGKGVIGKQPHIPPGQSHEYVSGVDFTGPIGRMQGHYIMKRTTDNSLLKVEIPPFVLCYPFLNN